MTSDTSSAYGSRVERHGSGRRTRAYHSRSAPTSMPLLVHGGRGQVQFAPEVTDLVAQLGCVLDAQLFRGGQHLLVELAHRVLDLGRGHVRALLAPAAPLGGDLGV